MKVWTKIRLENKHKDIDKIANSLVKYIDKEGAFNEVYKKYQIHFDDKNKLESHMANRIAGLLLLYFAKDTKRINDIVNKYNYAYQQDVHPELEGYVDRK